MKFVVSSIDLLDEIWQEAENRQIKKNFFDRELFDEEYLRIVEYFFIDFPISTNKCNKVERFFDNIVSQKYAIKLLEMRLRLGNSIRSLISYSTSSIASLSLLFGLCNSRASYNIIAFFGSSLPRIPNV